MKTFLTALAVSAITATSAFAASPASIPFAEADISGNGVVSAGELVQSNLVLKQFRSADANGDGQWTVEEFAAVKQLHNNDNFER